MTRILILLLALTTQANAQISYEGDYLTVSQKNELKSILDEALSSQKLPSVLAAATLNDKVIWARGVGYSDIANKVSPKVEVDLYRWASVSKVTTERLAQALEEKGLLDQNRPISDYLNIVEPSFFRRCFKDDVQLQKFFTCTKNYGGFGPIVMMQGFPRCFNPSTFDKVQTTVGNTNYTASVVDQSKTDGVVVYRDSQNKTKCQASFETKLAYVSSNKITTNLLLAHKAGILHYEYFDLNAEPAEAQISNTAQIKNRKDNGVSQMSWAISAFYPKHPLLFLPGAGRSYSTFGYNLAGVVMEKAAHTTYDKLLVSMAYKLSGLSIQPDYLGLPVAGPFRRSHTYKLEDQKYKQFDYTTDNSYKLAGGGIMSTIVDLGKFCAGISTPGLVTKNGTGSYAHSGAHPKRTESLLVLKTGGSGDKQCLVLMTNTEHGSVDLEDIRKKLESKLISWRVWKPYRAPIN